MILKFEQFKNNIDLVIYNLLEVIDYCNGTASITIQIVDKEGNEYAHQFEEKHNYTKDLAKTEILTWCDNQLKNFEVK